MLPFFLWFFSQVIFILQGNRTEGCGKKNRTEKGKVHEPVNDIHNTIKYELPEAKNII